MDELIGKEVAIERLYPDGRYLYLTGRVTAIDEHMLKLEEGRWEDMTPSWVLEKMPEAAKRGAKSGSMGPGTQWLNTSHPTFIGLGVLD